MCRKGENDILRQERDILKKAEKEIMVDILPMMKKAIVGRGLLLPIRAYSVLVKRKTTKQKQDDDDVVPVSTTITSF